MSLQDQNILHLSTNADSSTNSKKTAIKAKFNKKKLFFAQQIYTLYEQKFYNQRQLLSNTIPKDSEYLKSLEIGLLEVGAKNV